jgi:hypothetical protein
MNELPGLFGVERVDGERGSESGLLNFTSHSQNLSSFGRRYYLFTSQCSYYSVFLDTVLVLFA